MLDGHKTMGFITLILLFFQLALGSLSHSTPFVTSRTSTRLGVRVVHVLSGVALLVVAWATIGLGLSEWTSTAVSSSGRKTMKALFILCVFLFLL
jgi:cytochrome b561